MNHIKNKPIGTFCGALGHHKYFLTNQEARENIFSFSHYILTEGIEAFLRREYPAEGIKRIIINEIDNHFYIVDGNKHLVSLLLAKPDLTPGDLLQYNSSLLRFWKKGIEETNSNGKPYEIFIPLHIDTNAVPQARIGYDNFKTPPETIKIIPADIPFDSPVFIPEDQGKPLRQTAEELSSLMTDYTLKNIR